jgi:hypothetical protein
VDLKLLARHANLALVYHLGEACCGTVGHVLAAKAQQAGNLVGAEVGVVAGVARTRRKGCVGLWGGHLFAPMMTIFPLAKSSAVARGSLDRMMQAAKRLGLYSTFFARLVKACKSTGASR